MAHHRWFASGAGSDQPHQPAAAGNERDGISDQATNACGTTTSSPPAASNNHDVSELRGNSPTAVDGSRRRELPWRKRKHPLGKVGLVAVAGTYRGINKVRCGNISTAVHSTAFLRREY